MNFKILEFFSPDRDDAYDEIKEILKEKEVNAEDEVKQKYTVSFYNGESVESKDQNELPDRSDIERILDEKENDSNKASGNKKIRKLTEKKISKVNKLPEKFSGKNVNSFFYINTIKKYIYCCLFKAMHT